jgi:hypothetical protein
MSTHAVERRHIRRPLDLPVPIVHAAWLAAGLAIGFLVPFVFADVLEVQRDFYYGIYGAVVIALFAAWARSTGQSAHELIARRWPWAVALGFLCGGLLALVAVRAEASDPRPDGLELAGAIVWRGVFYGAVDGLLLSSFPILVVFAAFAGTRLRARRTGTIAVAAIALAASLAMTAVYHLGYSDFRGEKVTKPLTGDLVWSAPTLLTLNPVGAPIAHIGLHTAAVVESYETDVFLPPHQDR